MPSYTFEYRLRLIRSDIKAGRVSCLLSEDSLQVRAVWPQLHNRLIDLPHRCRCERPFYSTEVWFRTQLTQLEGCPDVVQKQHILPTGSKMPYLCAWTGLGDFGPGDIAFATFLILQAAPARAGVVSTKFSTGSHGGDHKCSLPFIPVRFTWFCGPERRLVRRTSRSASGDGNAPGRTRKTVNPA